MREYFYLSTDLSTLFDMRQALLAGHRVIHKPVQGYYLAQVLREVVETSR